MGKEKYIKIAENIAVWLVGFLLLVFVLPKLMAFFAPFVVGFVLSLIGLPLVHFLEKNIKIRRKYGTVIIIVCVIALLVLACYGCGMALSIGLRSFMEYLPTLYENAIVELSLAGEHLQAFFQRIPYLKNLDLQNMVTKLGEAAGDYFTNPNQPVVTTIGDFVSRIPDILVGIIMGLLSTYYFIADHEKLKQMIKRHTSAALQNRCRQIYDHILKAVGGYFKAQLKIMMVIYVIVFAGLMILRVRYAWLIGFGIAFLDMLPVFGTGTILIPWAIIKIFSGNYTTAIGMVILYVVTLVVHQLIQPKMVGDTVGMNTFATIFFMYIGYKLAGVIGMIIAIPIGMILVFFYKDGGFDNIIWCFKELAKDFNNMRRIER